MTERETFEAWLKREGVSYEIADAEYDGSDVIVSTTYALSPYAETRVSSRTSRPRGRIG
jgi:hypothetical protein